MDDEWANAIKQLLDMDVESARPVITYKYSQAEMYDDLIFMLKQSILIEHKQDHDKILALREKYGL